MSDQDTTKINRYLLGQLPQEEVDRIEARLLSETGLFELAESVEDEIIDLYVRGELAPAERRRFERRLLSSERIAERVAFARALAAHGGRRQALPGPAAIPAPARVGREATVVPLFRPAAARLAWAATLAVAVLGGWLAFQVIRLDDRAEGLEAARTAALEEAEEAAARARLAESAAESARRHETEAAGLRDELAEAQTRLAELETEESPEAAGGTERRVRRPGDYGERAATASLLLAMGTRSGAEPPLLQLGAGDEWAELQLVFSGRKPAGPISVTVSRGDRVAWRDDDVADVESLGVETVAVLTLPEDRLEEGLHVVELRGAEGRLLGSYEVEVER